MEDINNIESKFGNSFNINNKKFSIFEKYFYIKKKNFTNIKIYYFFCILFNFKHLISLSGDFSNDFNQKNNNSSFQKIIKSLTCYYLIQYFNLSLINYTFIIFLTLLLFIMRIYLYLYVIKINYCNKYKSKLKLINLYLKIITHIIFLFFPYIIEYLSFSYYIYFFNDKFIIKTNIQNKIFIFIIIIINTILIILYNIDNYINIVCSNKEYSYINYYFFLKTNKSKINKSIEYKYSNHLVFTIIILQNLVIISTIENYLEEKYIIIFKIVISVFLLFIYGILFIKKIYEFNYMGFINISFNTLIIFCFYSIIIDLIFYILKFRIKDMIIKLIIIFLKLLMSYITYIIFDFKKSKLFEFKIVEILFKEKNVIKEKDFINSFIICIK